MSDEGSDQPKDYLSQAWEVLSRLSDEVINAARTKADQSGFNKGRGIVGLDESLINLVSSRDLLKDGIEKNKLQQLPLSLQKKLFSDLEQILDSVTLMTKQGTDEIEVLTERIEALNSDIWRFGLHNLSTQVLGFQTKLNQLKHQETEIIRLQDQIREALTLRDQAQGAWDEISTLQGRLKDLDISITAAANGARDNASEIKQLSERASADTTNIQTFSESAARLLADVTGAHGTVNSLTEVVRQASQEVENRKTEIETLLSESGSKFSKNQADYEELHAQINEDAEALNKEVTASLGGLVDTTKGTLKSEIESTQASIAQAIEDFQEASKDNQEAHDAVLKKAVDTFTKTSQEQLTTQNEQVEELINESSVKNKSFLAQGQSDHEQLKKKLEELEEQIKDKINQATGYTLFGAFQRRQNDVAMAKRNWGIATLTCVGFAVLLGLYVVHSVHSVQDVRFEFFAKLSLGLPIVYAIGFCSIQYSKERRLEEEYMPSNRASPFHSDHIRNWSQILPRKAILPSWRSTPLSSLVPFKLFSALQQTKCSKQPPIRGAESPRVL